LLHVNNKLARSDAVRVHVDRNLLTHFGDGNAISTK
jgi:hypothetical protein